MRIKNLRIGLLHSQQLQFDFSVGAWIIRRVSTLHASSTAICYGLIEHEELKKKGKGKEEE